jgi:hypothetical protein
VKTTAIPGANCDFCYRPAVANVLSKRVWWAPWRGPRWFFVCLDDLRSKKWRHG